MTTIIKGTASVWRVNGKGRAWRTKAAAYRSAAIKRVNEACGADCPGGHSRIINIDGALADDGFCVYCSRECEGKMCMVESYGPDGETYGPCDGTCGEPAHSYRYRLVGRLARWLAWRDKTEANGEKT